MPYIEQRFREALNNRLPVTSGELNYFIIRVVDSYIQRIGLGYNAVNEVIGVLECVKQELYRRVAAPYEDKKCRENGEVFLSV